MGYQLKNRLTKLISVSVFILVFPISSYCQPTGFSPKIPLNDLIINQWTNQSGLRSNNLTSIHQSKSGYIWITSHNGIHRFDGVKFTGYSKNNVPVFATNTAFSVFEDNNGMLYFATEASGIIQYSDNNFYANTNNNSFPKATLTSMLGSDEIYWIGTKNHGLFTISKDSKVENINEIPEISINCLSENKKGEVFASTDGNGLYMINKDTVVHFTTEDGLLSNVVNFSHVNDDKVYIGTINGLNLWDGKTISKISAFDGIEINQLSLDSYGSIWAATETGLARLSEGEKELEYLTAEKDLGIKQISGLLFDSEGSLWLSTKKAGLIRLKQGSIKNISSSNGLTSDRVNVVERNKSDYYIGTDDGIINIYDGKSTRSVHFGDKFHNAGIRDFLFEENGDWWVVSYEGALKISGNQSTLYNVNNGLPANEIRRIFQDSKGQIWLGSRVAGLIKFNQKDNKNHIVYNRSKGMASDYIFSIEEDMNGNIVLGTNAGGLSVLYKNNEIKTYHIKNDDSGILIFNTFINEENIIFACTNIGLFAFQDEGFKKIELQEKIELSTFFDLVDDKMGGYWLTSNSGIVKIKKSDVNKFLTGEISTVETVIFDHEDGMTNNECTGATRSYYDELAKQIWVPTFSGAAIINPKLDFENNKIPPVYISEFTIDGKKINLNNDDFEVDFRAYRYTFNFTSLSFLSPSKVEFMYKLEGFDQEWIGPTSERFAQYTNLPAKKMTFLVKGSNSEGIWNEKPTSFTFEIIPFFYKTTWFLVLVIISILLVLFGFYKWRLHNITKRNIELKKINDELDKFVYSASHDLRAPLASIMSLVSLLNEDSDETEKKEYIKLIDQCAHKMDVFIHDIIDYSRNKNKGLDLEKILLKELIEESYESLQYLKIDFNVELKYEISGQDFINNDQRRLRVILSNLIANAINYSDKKKPNSYVSIKIHSNKDSVQFEITDNGIGIEASEISNIFNMFYRTDENTMGSGLGLYIVKEALDKLGGKIKVESEIGEGTTFSFTLINHQLTT